MIHLARIGVLAALIALMVAANRGDILLGLLAMVVGCYCWALLGETIADRDNLDGE